MKTIPSSPVSFESDYICGAHPEVLEKIIATNMTAMSGYGTDMYSFRAKEKIKKACLCDNADVYFLLGGTQTNSIIISSLLTAHEGVISAQSGHINTHEAGAIEYTGHKVLGLPHRDGKIIPENLKEFLESCYDDENREHMVCPGMVYISHPTEYGTLYTLEELTKISEICKYYNLPLFLDGARLGYALMSLKTNVSLPDIARLCDVFYIGGTKVGALCGEAVVFTKNNTPKHFFSTIKQHGALLAKGRLLGVQFDALFSDDLYFKISSHAIAMAETLKTILKDKGYTFYLESPTNQQFVVLENKQLESLKKHIIFSFWERLDENHTVIRLATSWSTTEEDINYLEEIL